MRVGVVFRVGANYVWARVRMREHLGWGWVLSVRVRLVAEP